MDERLYWLWLQYVLKPGGKTKPIIDKYHSPKAFYFLGAEEWQRCFLRQKATFNRAVEKIPDDFMETVNFCQKHGLHIVTPDSEYYPENLLTLVDYPAVLFVRGDYTCLNFGVPFGVIGSRTPSGYGVECAKGIVSALCDNDALIVSGGALGIDSVAHKTAIHCGGKTVLIMGCGHGCNYLPENAEMRKEVSKNGALVSEYPPFTPVERYTFPTRNRIISGMSKAVAIIEAADKSGTFSTAKHAASQGRKLFVLPGDINSGRFAGSNKLISEGAIPIFSGNDILKKCDLLSKSTRIEHKKSDEVFPHLDELFDQNLSFDEEKMQYVSEKEPETETAQEKVEIITKKTPECISKNAEIVYNIMSDGINELDEITRQASLEIRHVLVALTELEMLGYAHADGPNIYRLN